MYGYVSEFIEWYILLCLEYPSLSYFDSTFSQGQGRGPEVASYELSSQMVPRKALQQFRL